MVHPYDLQMGARLDIFLKDLSDYKAALEARGYALGWPKPLPVWHSRALRSRAARGGLCLRNMLRLYAVVLLLADERQRKASRAALLGAGALCGVGGARRRALVFVGRGAARWRPLRGARRDRSGALRA